MAIRPHFSAIQFLAMTIVTAENNMTNAELFLKSNDARRTLLAGWLALLLSFGICSAGAARIIGPWVPVFKGIEHLVATNEPANPSDQLQVVHVLRVDLQDPDISLFTTPRISNYIADVRETAGLMTKDFLQRNHLQVAINANVFDPTEYYLPAGTPMVVSGVEVSQGVVVSTQEGRDHAASIQFSTNNEASFILTNWPPASTEGVLHSRFRRIPDSHPRCKNCPVHFRSPQLEPPNCLRFVPG